MDDMNETQAKENSEPRTGSSPEETSPALIPAYDFSGQVQRALLSRASRKSTLLQNLGGLLLSLLFFFSLGFARDGLSGVLMLIGVLFIHEAGHWIGMKCFRYRDVKMFFIPMFGAAVSGHDSRPSARKDCIVSLLGPVPGILLGIGLLVISALMHQPMLRQFAQIMLFLNLFNLIPMFPLDGGRVIDALLLSRHPWVEVIGKVLTAGLMGWIAYASRDFLFGFIALMVAASLRSTWACSRTAYRLRKAHTLDGVDAVTEIPAEQLNPLVGELVQRVPQSQTTPEHMASLVEDVWQRVVRKPAGVLASIFFLLLYFFFFALGIVGTAACMTAGRAHAEPAASEPAGQELPS